MYPLPSQIRTKLAMRQQTNGMSYHTKLHAHWYVRYVLSPTGVKKTQEQLIKTKIVTKR